MSPTYGHVTKLFLEFEFQNKGNKQTNKKKKKRKENAISQQNFAVFLAGIDSRNKIIKMLHRKGQKNVFDKIVIIRTGTYL